MKNIVMDFSKKAWMVFTDAVSSFGRNRGITSASSLAFFATLALIPTLFLLTALVGFVIGSSERALLRTEEMVTQLIPNYSEWILREVQFLASHKTTIGLFNVLVILWILTPFVSDIRSVFGSIFKKKPGRPFLLELLLDFSITVVFLLGIGVFSVVGVIFSLAEKWSFLRFLPEYLAGIIPFLFFTVVVYILYYAFSTRVRSLHLLLGALAASLLWFTMRPAFTLFLTYNPGYGVAFGSFKSLFVAIIWIYYSFAVFLFGGEVAASLNRKDMVIMKRLLERTKGIPGTVTSKYVHRIERGTVIFSEGEEGREMFAVLKGSVGIQKGEETIAVIRDGDYFGEMSFLLSIPRVATAVVLEDVELITINDQTMDRLMKEFPEFMIKMVREMAKQLREPERHTV